MKRLPLITYGEAVAEIGKWLDVVVEEDEHSAIDRALFVRCQHALEVEQRLVQNADIPSALETLRREHPELSDKLIPLQHRLRALFEGVSA